MSAPAAEAAPIRRFERDYRWLHSGELVGEMIDRQKAAIEQLGFAPRLDIVISSSNTPSESYLNQMVRHGNTVGADVRIHRCRYDWQAAWLIGRLNDNPDVNGVMPLLGGRTPKGTERMRRAMTNPTKDVDAVNFEMPAKERRFMPATPLGMRALAEKYLGHTIEEMDPDGVVVIGNGPLVGGPLVEGMQANGFEPGTWLKSREEVYAWREAIEGKIQKAEREGRPLQKMVVFAAVPVGNLIDGNQLPDLPEGILIIDAGYGPVKNQNGDVVKWSSNVDPATICRHGLVRVTPFRDGVGPATTGVLFDHLIEGTHMQYEEDRARRLATAPFSGSAMVPLLTRSEDRRARQAAVHSAS